MSRPTGISTVGDLRRAVANGNVPRRTVHQEVRDNLIQKLRAGEQLFPGIVGYDDTVVPQLVNALLSQHNFIQVGLFNILQEGDVRIKGYPVRLPLDVMMAFTANPEDYTARGKIITPLKDRIGSEIRTHYPAGRGDAMAITAQEAWMTRDGIGPRAEVPSFVAEVVEEIAFQARQDRRIDKRSGVSQRLPISAIENVVSNAERRALVNGEELVVPRVTDIYAALPAIPGKLGLGYG